MARKAWRGEVRRIERVSARPFLALPFGPYLDHAFPNGGRSLMGKKTKPVAGLIDQAFRPVGQGDKVVDHSVAALGRRVTLDDGCEGDDPSHRFTSVPDQLLRRQPDIFRDLTEQWWRDVASFVHRDGRSSPVDVPILNV